MHTSTRKCDAPSTHKRATLHLRKRLALHVNRCRCSAILGASMLCVSACVHRLFRCAQLVLVVQRNNTWNCILLGRDETLSTLCFWVRWIHCRCSYLPKTPGTGWKSRVKVFFAHISRTKQDTEKLIAPIDSSWNFTSKYTLNFSSVSAKLFTISKN